MRIWTIQVSQGSVGAHPTISMVGPFLCLNAPDFGPAIAEFDIELYFPGPSLAFMSLDQSQRLLVQLPKYRFLRKSRRFTIKYESKATTSKEIQEYGSRGKATAWEFLDRQFWPEAFTIAYREVRSQLHVACKRLKSGDDFDTARFLHWIDAREHELPQTKEAMHALHAETNRWREDVIAAMDEWEKLDVDWEDFHPEARAVLDKTFFWDRTDDFAPHGNDTGHDLLMDFMGWRKTHKAAPSQGFYEEAISDVLDDTDAAVCTREQTTLALAFAHLKIDAACPEWIRVKALESIHYEKSHLDQRFGHDAVLAKRKSAALSLMEEKLQTCTTM